MSASPDRRQVVFEVIAEVAGVDIDRVALDAELVADLGIDSPKALSLLVEIEDRLEIEIPDDKVAELHTVGDVLAALEAPAG